MNKKISKKHFFWKDQEYPEYEALKNLNDPCYIKSLTVEDLLLLAGSIRKFLISTMSQTGGHLSSNLGIVELVLALHYVFDVSHDVFIFDVGHQCYVHKILTGRSHGFSKLRKKNGLSGFPSPVENPADHFKTGHAGTAIALATGFALKHEMLGHCQTEVNPGKAIAIVGDGSLSNGESYESLNFISNNKVKNMLIIVNDNEMSISQTRSDACSWLSRIFNDSHSTDPLAIRYKGPVDGHDLRELISSLVACKETNNSTILHIKTLKGCGYWPSLVEPDKYHSTKPFEISSGRYSHSGSLDYTSFFGKLMSDAGERDETIVALTAAMKDGTGLDEFSRRFPRRFIDVGIAESLQGTLAASLSKVGLKPVCCVYATFAQRMLDQIQHDVLLNKLPVIYCMDRYGLVGEDGPTHHGIYAQNFICALPEIHVVNPTCTDDFRHYFNRYLDFKHTVVFQYPKSEIFDLIDLQKEYPFIHGSPVSTDSLSAGSRGTFDNELKQGDYLLVSKGEKSAIVYTGAFTRTACKVKETLLQFGFNPSIYAIARVKPLSAKLCDIILSRYDSVFIIEEQHHPSYLFSEFVSRWNAEGKSIHALNVPEIQMDHSSRADQLTMAGLDPESITRYILRQLQWGYIFKTNVL